MKKHLFIYGFLILIFITYNVFFRVGDARMDNAINIILSSILFGYITLIAFLIIKKIKNKGN